MQTDLDTASQVVDDLKISEIFHENTKQDRNFLVRKTISKQMYVDFNNQKRLYDLNRTIPLPQPNPELLGRRSLVEILQGRRSVRNFSAGPLRMDELSTFLHFTNGIRFRANDGFSFRHWPSAGGFYSIDLFITAQHIEDLAVGVYYYDPFDHNLRFIRDHTAVTAMQNASLGATGFAEQSSMGLFMVADFAKTKFKYNERGYRYVFLDSGHLGENIYLISTAMGLGACGVGGFYEREIDTLLGLDGVTEGVIYVLYVGRDPTAPCQPLLPLANPSS